MGIGTNMSQDHKRVTDTDSKFNEMHLNHNNIRRGFYTQHFYYIKFSIWSAIEGGTNLLKKECKQYEKKPSHVSNCDLDLS